MLDDLQLKIFSTGILDTNAYLVFNPKTKDCFVVDCPRPIAECRDFIWDNNLKLKFILLTHGHFDHIDGLPEFLKEFPAPFYIHSADGFALGVKEQPIFFKDEGEVLFKKNKLKIIQTPGHTRGSVSILLGQWLFSGDTLFYHSVGRTDLDGGDMEQLKNSIKNKLFILNPKTIVYPGHGEQTSIGEEIKNNPFV